MMDLETRLARLLNAVRSGNMGGNEYRVLNVPRASVYFTGNTPLGLTNGVGANVPWDVVDYDTDSMYSASNNLYLTARTAGLYLFTTTINIPNVPQTLRQVNFVKLDSAGATHIYGAQSNPGNAAPYDTNLTTTAQIVLNVGESVYVSVVQVSGANTNLTGVSLPNRLNGFQACLISTL